MYPPSTTDTGKTSLREAESQDLRRQDFITDQEVRWCPGCGDYSILAQTLKTLPELGIPREDFVFVSGIGCSSRFPYYVNTYGFHSIHGRAPAIATGIKACRPETRDQGEISNVTKGLMMHDKICGGLGRL